MKTLAHHSPRFKPWAMMGYERHQIPRKWLQPFLYRNPEITPVPQNHTILKIHRIRRQMIF